MYKGKIHLSESPIQAPPPQKKKKKKKKKKK